MLAIHKMNVPLTNASFLKPDLNVVKFYLEHNPGLTVIGDMLPHYRYITDIK